MPRPVRFGPYEFDRDAQVLTKHGHRLKLQGKPLQLLAALEDRPSTSIPGSRAVFADRRIRCRGVWAQTMFRTSRAS